MNLLLNAFSDIVSKHRPFSLQHKRKSFYQYIIKPIFKNNFVVLWKWLSHVWLFVIPWTIVYRAPLSMGFSRQEHWSRLPCPPSGVLPDPRIEPGSLTLQMDSLPLVVIVQLLNCVWLCDPMACSIPDLLVLHHLLEFAQILLYCIGLLSCWCYPTISPSVAPFSCLQSFPASGSFPMSWLFTSGVQSIGASASAWS